MEVDISIDWLHPAVGMSSFGEEVAVDLNAEWEEEDDGKMIVDSHEEDWARFHDVKVTGTVRPAAETKKNHCYCYMSTNSTAIGSATQGHYISDRLFSS